MYFSFVSTFAVVVGSCVVVVVVCLSVSLYIFSNILLAVQINIFMVINFI